MIRPTPTTYPGIFTVHTTNRDELAKLVSTLGPVTLSIASPSLARIANDHSGPPPTLPPGEFRDLLAAESAAAGVPEFAVLNVVIAILDATTPAGAVPGLVDVELPPTLIVGRPQQCAAVLATAEALVAAAPYGRGA
jgi:hypothetical protein